MNPKDAMYRWLHEGAQEVKDAVAKKKLQIEFENFDCNTLSKMTNKDLAIWQAKYPTDSPQFIIAAQEWERRAQEKQKISNLHVALIGLAGAIIGSVLTIVIPMLIPSQKVDNNISIQQQANANKAKQNPTQKPADIKTPVSQKP